MEYEKTVEWPEQCGLKRRRVQTVNDPMEGKLYRRRACVLFERPVKFRMRVLEDALVSPQREREGKKRLLRKNAVTNIGKDRS